MFATISYVIIICNFIFAIVYFFYIQVKFSKLLKENDKLSEENHKLLEENHKLLEENHKLLEENDKLLEENDKLLEENNSFKSEWNEHFDRITTFIEYHQTMQNFNIKQSCIIMDEMRVLFLPMSIPLDTWLLKTGITKEEYTSIEFNNNSAEYLTYLFLNNC